MLMAQRSISIYLVNKNLNEKSYMISWLQNQSFVVVRLIMFH